MLVKDAMTRNPVFVSPEDSLTHARRLMQRHSVRHLLVLRDGRLEGVITDRDIRDYMPSRCRDMAVHELQREIERISVDQVMSRLPATVTPDDPVSHGAAVMRARRVGCLPVLEGEDPVGILTTSDLLRVLAESSPVAPGTGLPLIMGDELPLE